jgi:hypothetical protein
VNAVLIAARDGVSVYGITAGLRKINAMFATRDGVSVYGVAA